MNIHSNLFFVRRSAPTVVLVLVASLAIVAGCASGAEKKDSDFSTSGSREADQRADQRMAKNEQLTGGNDDGGKKTDKANGASVAEEKKTLYERLGSEDGVKSLVDDVVVRWLADPQVNFTRKGVTTGGLSFSRGTSQEWQATPGVLAEIKKNLAQFIALKTAGPTRYDGPPMEEISKDRHVSNAEFDAAVGDLKASLEKLKIANQEQKELIALMESTRPQLVTEH